MMHSWGCATRDGVCANASFFTSKKLKQGQGIFDVVDHDDCQEESFSLARPMHVEIEPDASSGQHNSTPDPTISMARDRASASEAALRSRIGSDAATL